MVLKFLQRTDKSECRTYVFGSTIMPHLCLGVVVSHSQWASNFNHVRKLPGTTSSLTLANSIPGLRAHFALELVAANCRCQDSMTWQRLLHSENNHEAAAFVAPALGLHCWRPGPAVVVPEGPQVAKLIGGQPRNLSMAFLAPTICQNRACLHSLEECFSQRQLSQVFWKHLLKIFCRKQ